MEITIWFISILAGILVGFYIATQLERKIIRKTRLAPTKISVSYVVQ